MRSALNIYENELGTLSLNSGLSVAFGHQWRYLPSASIEVIEDAARKIVYDCDSFSEFLERSGLPYHEAVNIWEPAWENYGDEENRATGN